MALTDPYIAGLFAILGVIAGAWVTRNTEHEKWLRAERAKVFADFLRLIDEAFDKSADLLHTSSKDGMETAIAITKAYSVPLNHARIVRLYLPISKRAPFETLTKSIWALHASKELGDKRIIQVEDKLQEIQRLFEECL